MQRGTKAIESFQVVFVGVLRLLGATVVVAVTLTAVASAAVASETQSPLVGTWRTGVISQAKAEATLRRSGMAKWISRFRSQTPLAAPMAMVLVISAKEWDLYGKPKGKPRVEIDYDADYVVRGNTVEKIHSTGSTTFRWTVKGRKLTLRWLRSTEPPVTGIPDKVFQYSLYMTQSFTRST
jgi:hypothetical protein